MIKNRGLLFCASLLLCTAGYTHATKPTLSAQSSAQAPEVTDPYVLRISNDYPLAVLKKIQCPTGGDNCQVKITNVTMFECKKSDSKCMKHYNQLAAAIAYFSQCNKQEAENNTNETQS